MKAVITLEGQDLPIYEKGQEVKLIKRGWDMARGTVQKSTQKKLVLHADVDYVCHRREPQPIQMINFSQPVDNSGDGFERGLAIGYEEGRNSKR